MQDTNQLINATLRGDMAAFEQLYKANAPRLMGVCLRYSVDEADAKDILQDTFVRIYEKLSTYKTEGTFEAWARRIAVNIAIDYHRKRKPTKALDEQFNDYNSPATAEADGGVEQLKSQELLQLVQTLPPRYKMVFNLYVFEGFKHHEIATLLSISEGTSKSNLSDARTILKEKLLKIGYERY